jgi:hypothetical protein
MASSVEFLGELTNVVRLRQDRHTSANSPNLYTRHEHIL